LICSLSIALSYAACSRDVAAEIELTIDLEVPLLVFGEDLAKKSFGLPGREGGSAK
jgi:hypothetical protein